MRQSFTDFKQSQPQMQQQLTDVLKYSEMLCEALFQDIERRHKDSGYKFYIEEGRKYHKIVMECENGSKSVHAFVEKKFGNVYKAASWKAPATNFARGTIFDAETWTGRIRWSGIM